MDRPTETRIKESTPLKLLPLSKDDRFVLFALIARRRTPRQNWNLNLVTRTL